MVGGDARDVPHLRGILDHVEDALRVGGVQVHLLTFLEGEPPGLEQHLVAHALLAHVVQQGRDRNHLGLGGCQSQLTADHERDPLHALAVGRGLAVLERQGVHECANGGLERAMLLLVQPQVLEREAGLAREHRQHVHVVTREAPAARSPDIQLKDSERAARAAEQRGDDRGLETRQHDAIADLARVLPLHVEQSVPFAQRTLDDGARQRDAGAVAAAGGGGERAQRSVRVLACDQHVMRGVGECFERELREDADQLVLVVTGGCGLTHEPEHELGHARVGAHDEPAHLAPVLGGTPREDGGLGRAGALEGGGLLRGEFE